MLTQYVDVDMPERGHSQVQSKNNNVGTIVIEKRSNALPLCLPLDTGMRVDHERGICLRRALPFLTERLALEWTPPFPIDHTTNERG